MIKKNMTLRKIGIVALTLVLMVLVVFLVSMSFGYFNYMKKGDTLNVISIKGIDVEIINDSENNLNINEAYPMYDEEGMNNPPFEFTLTNNSNKALDIVLKIENDIDKQGSYPLLNMNYIRYSYKVGNGEYSTPSNLGENNIILTDTITKNETKEISIKLWIDKEAPNEVQGKYFFGKLIVEGTKALCSLNPGDTIDFDYTGDVQEFTATCPGYYKLETWGAQGGSVIDTYIGGYGGYSTGIIELNDNDNIDIYVGGNGISDCLYTCDGGYNGGGNGLGYGTAQSFSTQHISAAGGGATHIAVANNEYSTLGSYGNSNTASNFVLIVAAGGGGGHHHTLGENYSANGGAGGGYIGNNGPKLYGGKRSTGGTQTIGGTAGVYGSDGQFGLGGTSPQAGSGGGAGWYGGGSGSHDGAAGGSSYIANPNLTNKHMTCFNCTTSNDINTKTISNTCHSLEPTVDCAKEGNGYVRLTYLGDDPIQRIDLTNVTSSDVNPMSNSGYATGGTISYNPLTISSTSRQNGMGCGYGPLFNEVFDISTYHYLHVVGNFYGGFVGYFYDTTGTNYETTFYSNYGPGGINCFNFSNYSLDEYIDLSSYSGLHKIQLFVNSCTPGTYATATITKLELLSSIPE